MNILGIGGSVHDFSACVVRDGEIIVAIEEERLSRHKYHAVGRIPPSELRLRSVDHCLSIAGLTLDEVDLTVANDLVFSPMLRGLPNVELVNHHFAHAAHAYYQSPFDDSAVLVMDGFGSIRDGRAESTTYFEAHGNTINDIARWDGPVVPRDASRPFSWANLGHVEDSLGEFYSYVTELLGFGMYEEGKTMGLAAYGGERFAKVVAEILELEDSGAIKFRAAQRRELSELFKTGVGGGLDRDFEGCADMAQAAQITLERALLRRAEHLQSLTSSKNLSMSGGIFMNCVANRRLLVEGPFERVYVHGAAGDNGTALGAALWGYFRSQTTRDRVRPIIYGGHTYRRADLLAALEQRSAQVEWREVDDVAHQAADAIDAGQVVGWFQGGSEFGARALGNRSILADPRRPEMKDRINALVKGRERFRPFAPSVLWEEAGRYFDLQAESPYMCVNAAVRDEVYLPAVTHVDGTARVQTVRREDNPRYHSLIKAFGDRPDGVSVVLNTSFNEKEPIVETPAQAVDCFIRTQIDALFLGDFLVTKR